MKNKWTWIGIVAALLMVGGGVWAYSLRDSPELVKAREANQKVMEAFKNDNVSMEDRMKLVDQAREAGKNLNEKEQENFRREARNARMGAMLQKMDEFFALEDENERNAFLDQEIERFQEMRNQWQARRKERESKGEAEGESKGNDRGGRGWGRVQPGDKEGMLNRQRMMLDKSSPQQRAKFTEYFTAMRQRMESRGIEMPWGKR